MDNSLINYVIEDSHSTTGGEMLGANHRQLCNFKRVIKYGGEFSLFNAPIFY